jgi:hypothetical protein
MSLDHKNGLACLGRLSKNLNYVLFLFFVGKRNVELLDFGDKKKYVSQIMKWHMHNNSFVFGITHVHIYPFLVYILFKLKCSY